MVDLLTYPRPGYNGSWMNFIPVVTRNPLANMVPVWSCYDDADAPIYTNDDSGMAFVDWKWNSVPQDLAGCRSFQVRVWTSRAVELGVQLFSWDGSSYAGAWNWALPDWAGGGYAPVFASSMPDWYLWYGINLCTLLDTSIMYPIVGPGWTTVEFSVEWAWIGGGYLDYFPQLIHQNVWMAWLELYDPGAWPYAPFSFSVPYMAGVRAQAF